MAMENDDGQEMAYCKSCGEQIFKQAEICPSCGVRQHQAQNNSQGSKTDSGKWWGRVKGAFAVGTLSIFLGFFLLIGGGAGGSTGVAAFGFLLFIAGAVCYLLWSYSIYQDAKYVRESSGWNPEPGLFLIGSLFIAFVGWYYMIKRRNVTE